MLAAIYVVLTIAPGAVAADAAGPPAPRDDLAAEIAWARTTFPALRGLNFDAPVAKLLDWVPLGKSIEAYLYTSDHACMRIELGHDENNRLSGETRRRSENPARWPFDSLEWLTADRSLVRHQQWEGELDGHGWTYGALSFVDARVARFGGEPLTVVALCDGPWDWIPCAGGGDRPCDRCERLRIDTAAAGEGFRGRSSDYGSKRRFTCRESCPRRPRGAMDDAQERLQMLLRHTVVWWPRSAPISKLPALYRFRADCLREHHEAR